MKIIGLCGMSGSGKGSVGVIFRQFSIPVLDTDRLYHSLIEDADSECTKLIIQEFGEAVADEQGRIDRKILRSLVFAPNAKEKLARLNAITHACVKAETEKWILACKEKNVEMVCLDVPLLFESGMNEMCDIVIAIVAPRESCLERIVQRDCITPLQAQARLDSQLTSEALTRMCDFVIVNDDSLEILANRVKTILSSFS